ncbi:MAG: hypothetical protein DHS20C08_04660 [Rhodomicrobium sp.]|nr:MAG: hypothetical protein DHS20C08_04660 [Rhodomicrobium sp.]
MKQLTSFASGEISPRLFGRVDLGKYQNGAAEVENFVIWPHGGASKRPGSVYVHEISDSSAVPRLQEFQFSTTETYVLCFENNLIRIFSNGGIVTNTANNITGITAANPAVVTSTGHTLSNGDKIIIASVGGMVELNNREFTVANATANTFELTGIDSSAYTAYTSGGTASSIVEVTTTYTTAELPEMRFAQSADVLYIAHEDHALAKLSRTSNTSWTLTDVDLVDGPFRDINGDQTQKFFIAIDSSTTNVSGATQADPVVITTSSAHGYKSGDCVTFSSVGGMTEINSNRYFVIKLSDTTFSLRDESYRDVDGTGYTAYTSGGTVNRSVTKWGTYSEGATNFSLTADFAYFDSDMVGQLVRLYEPGQQTGISTPVAGAAISNSSVITNDAKVYGFNGLSGTSTWNGDWNLPTHETGVVRLSDAEDSDYVDAVFLHDVSVVVKITAVSNSTTATCEIVLNHVPADVITYGTSAWDEGAWSNYHGYPKAIGFHEQRFWAGGTNSDPKTGWASVTNAFESFSDGDNDNDSITFTVDGGKLDRILWISPGDTLAIGTTGGEYVVKSTESGAAITPGNISVRFQSSYGSTQYEPVRAGDALIFPARFGSSTNSARRLREFDYNFEQDKHKAPPLTIISEHITGAGVTYLDYAQEPNSLISAVRDDGQLVACTYERHQDVVAFHRHVMGGSFGSGAPVIETIANEKGDYGDELWMVVKRTIDGNTVRYVEYLSREQQVDDAKEDSVFVDASATYDGSATTTISGLWHLRGETVGVCGDGIRQLDATVSDTGTITIDSASKVHVGYRYTSKLKTLPIEASQQEGRTQSRIKRIVNVFLRVYRSSGGSLGTNDSTLDDITYRGGDGLSPQVDPDLYSGLVRVQSPSGYARELEIYIEHDDPYPMNITGLVAEMGQ